MIFPYRIETVFKELPVANSVIIAITVLSFALLAGGVLSEDVVDAMVLDGWRPAGMLGSLFLHAGFMHLAGNMIFLWVFGNAICGNTSNLWYPVLYLGFGIAAGAAHVLMSGDPAVGASGAINGVVGMALAMYPQNRVSMFYFFFYRAGTFRVPLWVVSLVWLALDMWGAASGGGQVAYWAHIGGFFAGLTTGYVALRTGWVTLGSYDNRSLEEILTGKTAEARRERMRREEEGEAEPAATADSLVMTLTPASFGRWRVVAEGQTVSATDAAIIEGGGEAGQRKTFELLYAIAFLELNHSFHRSLVDYYRRVARGEFHPHDMKTLADFLRIVESDIAAMVRVGFVRPEVMAVRDESRLARFLATGSEA